MLVSFMFLHLEEYPLCYLVFIFLLCFCNVSVKLHNPDYIITPIIPELYDRATLLIS